MSIPATVVVEITTSNGLKIEKIRQWQTAGFVHPLTCGSTACQAVLDVEEINGEVILVCPDCTYTQGYIPSVVISTDLTKSPFWQHRPVD